MVGSFLNLFSSRQSKDYNTQPAAAPPASSSSSPPAPPAAATQQAHHHAPAKTLPVAPVAVQAQASDLALAPDPALPNGVGQLGPTTLSVPLQGSLDGYCVSVSLSPELAPGLPSGSFAGGNGLTGTYSLQLAQHMLQFATQQATLLQQALPYLLNLPPARVTDKLKDLLVEVQAKPALEKFMKVTGASEPMAQRVCIEYINRHGKGKVDPSKMLQFYNHHKDTVDFGRPLTVQDLLRHMDVATCIKKVQERLPGIPHQTAELAATLCMADADSAVQLLTAASAAAPPLAGPVFITDMYVDPLGPGGKAQPYALPGGPAPGVPQGTTTAAAALLLAPTTSRAAAANGPPSGGAGTEGAAAHVGAPGAVPLAYPAPYGAHAAHHGLALDPAVDSAAGLAIAGELKQFTDQLLQLQQQQQQADAASAASPDGSTAVLLPPSQIDMLSNLVLQSNAAINRYLQERQQLHKDLATLRKHKEWADSRINDLIKKACEADKPFAEELKTLRDEVKRLRTDKEALEARCQEMEGALRGLKESAYKESAARREAEHKLQALQAEVKGASLREAELQMELAEAQQQVKNAAKKQAAVEKQKTKLAEEKAEAVTAAKAEREREVEKLRASLRAAEKLAKERQEQLEAERAARSKEQKAAEQAAQAAEQSRTNRGAEQETRHKEQLAAAQEHAASLEGKVAELTGQLQQLAAALQDAQQTAAQAQAQAQANAAAAAAAAAVANVAQSKAAPPASAPADAGEPLAPTPGSGGHQSAPLASVKAPGGGNGGSSATAAGAGSSGAGIGSAFMAGHWSAPDFLGLALGPGAPPPPATGAAAPGAGAGAAQTAGAAPGLQPPLASRNSGSMASAGGGPGGASPTAPPPGMGLAAGVPSLGAGGPPSVVSSAGILHGGLGPMAHSVMGVTQQHQHAQGAAGRGPPPPPPQQQQALFGLPLSGFGSLGSLGSLDLALPSHLTGNGGGGALAVPGGGHVRGLTGGGLAVQGRMSTTGAAGGVGLGLGAQVPASTAVLQSLQPGAAGLGGFGGLQSGDGSGLFGGVAPLAAQDADVARALAQQARLQAQLQQQHQQQPGGIAPLGLGRVGPMGPPAASMSGMPLALGAAGIDPAAGMAPLPPPQEQQHQQQQLQGSAKMQAGVIGEGLGLGRGGGGGGAAGTKQIGALIPNINGPPTQEALLRQLELLRKM